MLPVNFLAHFVLYFDISYEYLFGNFWPNGGERSLLKSPPDSRGNNETTRGRQIK